MAGKPTIYLWIVTRTERIDILDRWSYRELIVAAATEREARATRCEPADCWATDRRRLRIRRIGVADEEYAALAPVIVHSM